MVASTLSADPMEEVAARCGDTPAFFQLYTPTDRELAASLVQRAEAAGFKGIVVTLDTWVTGWRPRDLATSNFPQLRGFCLANYTSDPVFRSRLAQPPEANPMGAVAHWAGVFGNPLTWDDLPWLRSLTDLPLIFKGICDPDDARRALDAGADGIYVSNHGGRQANGGLPALDCLPGVVAAAAGHPVLFDSGVRSGADIVKALALGATAVGIGRPYAYGLALGGAKGAEHVLRCLLAEADLIMAVDGYPSLADLTPDALRPIGRLLHHRLGTGERAGVGGDSQPGQQRHRQGDAVVPVPDEQLAGRERPGDGGQADPRRSDHQPVPGPDGPRQAGDRRAEQQGAENGVHGQAERSGPYLLDVAGLCVSRRDLDVQVHNHAEPELQGKRDERAQISPGEARRPRRADTASVIFNEFAYGIRHCCRPFSSCGLIPLPVTSCT
jgi:isopentenyl diphosphate isomerase/L-lactate dehydrogenase-like FMN-dependent dehydrogenase